MTQSAKKFPRQTGTEGSEIKWYRLSELSCDC